MLTRRQLLKRGAAGSAVLMMPSGVMRAAPAGAASPALKAYATDLGAFMPPLAVPDASGNVALTVQALKKVVHPALPSGTTVWSYELAGAPKRSWLGPLIAVDTAQATHVSFGYDGTTLDDGHLFHNSIDTAVLDPWVVDANAGDMRFMTHLHGAFVDDENDGNPEATEHEAEYAPGDTETKDYPAQDRACLMWYHQHAHGLTHLNVYAGLAGGYLVRDRANLPTADGTDGVHLDTGRLDNPLGLPANVANADGTISWYEVPLVIQDRTFASSGELAYPAAPWAPEFFGDVLCVNGAVRPFLNAEPRLYRFRVINGCNARFLNLDLRPSSLTGVRPPMWVIGSDGGLIDKPFRTPTLVIAPGERYDLLVDFAGFAGQRVTFNNSRLPAGVANPAPPESTTMQFLVGTSVQRANLPEKAFDAAAPLTSDLPAAKLSSGADFERMITLEEVMGAKGPLAVVLNGRSFEGRPVQAGATTGYPFDKATVLPTDDLVRNGDTELWNFINTTVDSHPMHMHLVQFQVVKRQPFDVVGYQAALAGKRANDPAARLDVTPFLKGKPAKIPPQETGWKDTVQAHPGQVTTIKAKFDLRDFAAPQDYVYHCHILEHETNSMMQPYTVIARR